jgi:polycomb protein EED
MNSSTATTKTATSNKPMYVFISAVRRPQEPNQSKNQIYSIEFFPTSRNEQKIFACSGGRRVTIFAISDNDVDEDKADEKDEDEGNVKAIRGFLDEDETEDFYCSCWAISPEQQPLLCVGGESGVIKILNVDSCTLFSYFLGHGGPIYDLSLHPQNEDLIFSCSKDESIRLWSLQTRTCLIVFAGDQGHRDSVLSLDVHISGKWLASSGMDNTIKIWELDSDAVKQAIRDGRAREEEENPLTTQQPTKKKSRAPFIQFPAFTTRRVHTDYIDCVKWIGDLVMTKSIESKCCLWKPDTRRRANSVALLRVYPYICGSLWYVRFGLNSDLSIMAVASDDGTIFLYDVDAGGPAYQQISPAMMKTLIRSVRFSPDDEYIVGCGDDGTIRCYRRQ